MIALFCYIGGILLNFQLLDNLNSTSLASNYVFYERLEKDYPNVYNSVRSSLENTKTIFSSEKTNTAGLRAMEIAEANKEVKVLQSIFSVPFSSNLLYDKNFYMELIKAINTNLGIKEIFERNALLIQNSNGMKNIMSWFSTYFTIIWKKEADRIVKIIIEQVQKSRESVDTIIENVMNIEIPNLVKQTLLHMFSSDRRTEMSFMNEKYHTAYQQLYNHLNSMQMQNNPLLEQFRQIYKIDEITNILSEEIKKGIINSTTVANNASKKIKTSVNKQIHQRGGLAMEAFENFTADMLISQIKIKDGTIAGGVVNSGLSGMKADNIITFNIDTQQVQDTIDKLTPFSGRPQFVEEISNLEEAVKNINNGFIIYSSAKNYSYNENFKGFSSGEEINMSTLKTVMSSVSLQTKAEQIIGAILQLANGAIGAKILDKADIEEQLAHYIAYLLFDDVEQIGKINQSGSNSLHLMNLNGIYIPLSVILHSLANAIEDVEANPRRIVNVTITPPKSIIFPVADNRKIGSQGYWMRQNNATALDAWNYQREQALQVSKISAKFLKNFQELIQEYIQIT